MLRALTIRAASVDELLAQGGPLFRAHYRDTLTGDDPPLSVRGDLFLAMEKAGVLIALGAFDGETLIGYAVGMVVPHQFSEDVVASACAMFVQADHRRGGTCTALMDEFEKEAYLRGATIVQWHAKTGTVFDTILRRRRTRELETVFVKRLETPNG